MFASTALEIPVQLFQPLSHVASILTKKCSAYSASRRGGQTRFEVKGQDEVLCLESFENALKSVSELLDSQFLDKRVLEHLEHVKPCHEYRDVHISRQRLPWRVSHVSSDSFEGNKILANNRTNQFYFRRTQIRTFKTRSSKGISGRKESLYDTTFGTLDEPEFSKSINPFKATSKDKEKMRNLNKESNELKSLINNSQLTDKDQQNIRVAFAEGYLAADPAKKPSAKTKLFSMFKDLLGIVLVLVILVSLMGDVTGGSVRRVLSGAGNEVHPEEIDVTFSDVKGVEEAKQELQEVVEFLKNPEKFSVLGGKLPKGVLLVGPPGTGKTLLARAVAGEAGVPFFHAAGPEFDEILVGQGARRVRDLFNTAKLRAPCVIFIDEIDSVGAKRTSSVLHPYANQTINQLLTEMDGFRQNEGVVVLGATNRRDDLDKALLRPGRFDVEVQVPVPDLNGRKEIFELYLSKIKKNDDVTPDVCAKRTTGFTGADIENMVNQAALRAAIDGQTSVNMKYLENARDKLIMGPERKSRIPDEESNTITAYHEAGHTIVALKTKDAVTLHKVTIVSRGPSLGHTAFIPDKETYHMTKAQILAQLDTLMGGRIAEELIFGLDMVTTGASDDLKRATFLATSMVRLFGMSEKVANCSGA